MSSAKLYYQVKEAMNKSAEKEIPLVATGGIKISLIHPSRGRPTKAAETYKIWMSRAKYPERIEHILSLDFSDTTNEEYQINASGKYERWPQSKTIIDHNNCVVEATNQAAKLASGDLLVYMSDDITPPQDWDEEIVRSIPILKCEPGAIFVIRVNDGHQPFENRILIMPIMSRALYAHLKYFWNPIYKSMWCDCDLYAVCNELNCIVNAPGLLFPHEQGPEDNTYRRSNANFESGRAIFNERRKQFGWPSAFVKMKV